MADSAGFSHGSSPLARRTDRWTRLHRDGPVQSPAGRLAQPEPTNPDHRARPWSRGSGV